jgi:hypothetical protein
MFSDLLPVDIQPAYDAHRDLLTLPRAPRRPHANGLRINRDATELRRSLPCGTTGIPGQTPTPTRRCMSSNMRPPETMALVSLHAERADLALWGKAGAHLVRVGVAEIVEDG